VCKIRHYTKLYGPLLAVLGWVGLGQLADGLGWIGSHKMDPWTTLTLGLAQARSSTATAARLIETVYLSSDSTLSGWLSLWTERQTALDDAWSRA